MTGASRQSYKTCRLQVERLDLLPGYCDEKNTGRTCMYLTSCCNYLPEPDDTTVSQQGGSWGMRALGVDG